MPDSSVLLEKINWRKFGPVVIGVDEVGRGCLAGPVGAAATLFDFSGLEDEVTDSKALTPKRREALYEKIMSTHPTAFAFASVEEIDEINILQASFLAMKRAVDLLGAHEFVRAKKLDWERVPILIDGHMKSPHWDKTRQTPLIKGDLRCAPISAASIVAKVLRDRWMMEQESSFPEYGFGVHKGYSTVVHKEALVRKGPCALHRKTFSGVKELL